MNTVSADENVAVCAIAVRQRQCHPLGILLDAFDART
jgi:hypothetical protein